MVTQHHKGTVVNATELSPYTWLKWSILCYVSFPTRKVMKNATLTSMGVP